MELCKFCEEEFHDGGIEIYCCYWCELHGELQEKILTSLQKRATEAKDYGIPQFVLGLNDAKDIVKKEFSKNK